MSDALDVHPEVSTFCRVCEPACGLVATVDDGRIVRVRADDDHPVSKGFACTKGIEVIGANKRIKIKVPPAK
jgi:anaerobic selenocysteine-containing dehydrogenase